MSQSLIATIPDDGNGFSAKYYWDDDRPEFDRLHIVRTQIVDSVLDHNREAQANLHNHRSGFGNLGIHHVAKIPLATIERWMTEGFNWFQSTDAEKRKKLNDPANAKFRTRKSRM